MKVDGQASLLLNEHLGTGGHANVSSTGPVLGQSPAQKAFEKLGSGSAVAAKVGEAVADTAQRGGAAAAAAISKAGSRAA